MKTVKLITLMVLLSILFASQVSAFKQKDLEKLKSTNKCEQCSLRKANLRDANLIGAKLNGTRLIGANLRGGHS